MLARATALLCALVATAFLVGAPAVQARPKTPRLTELRCVPVTTPSCQRAVRVSTGRLIQLRGRNLVAAHDGKVEMAESDRSGYGNILVLDVKGSGIDLLYAHMQGKATVREGDKVIAGEKVGKVGDSGNASGCHLHFEMHSAPGFWEGGQAMSKVTKYLKEWDAYS